MKIEGEINKKVQHELKMDCKSKGRTE